jgi:hypothetical protein
VKKPVFLQGYDVELGVPTGDYHQFKVTVVVFVFVLFKFNYLIDPFLFVLVM